jgi:hypothetical protein
MELVCKVCGSLFFNSHRTRKTCSVQCGITWRTGSGSPRFKGGSINSDGYRIMRRGKGRSVGEHRLVMEQALGRRLLSTEVVHHRNGNRLDNRLENLELIQSQSAHRRLHSYRFRSQTHKQCSSCEQIKQRNEFKPTHHSRPTEDPHEANELNRQKRLTNSGVSQSSQRIE